MKERAEEILWTFVVSSIFTSLFLCRLKRRREQIKKRDLDNHERIQRRQEEDPLSRGTLINENCYFFLVTDISHKRGGIKRRGDTFFLPSFSCLE
jgi:hypothetical protein